MDFTVFTSSILLVVIDELEVDLSRVGLVEGRFILDKGRVVWARGHQCKT